MAFATRPTPFVLVFASVIAATGGAQAGPAPKVALRGHAPKPSAGAVAVRHDGALRRTAAHVASSAASHHANPGRSVGSPTDGHLIGGTHLPEAGYLRIVPSYAAGDVRWGTELLVGLIDRAGRAVRKQFPDAVLSVGHLSKQGGGEVDRHASHESGRDADIGFFVKNQLNKPIYADHFVTFQGDGTAATWPGARFDDARNWALVAAIVTEPRARVTHIFVASHLRARLLSYAERIGASPAIRGRAAELLAQPRGSLPHDDHFHVRIACPPGMDKCIEQPMARRFAHGHGTGLAGAHAAGHAHGGAAAPHAAPAHSPKPQASPKPKAAPKSASEARSEDDSEKAEATVPNLAPAIPGLDAAVIPSPLTPATLMTPAPAPAPAAPEMASPPSRPVDDPDGILDERR